MKVTGDMVPLWGRKGKDKYGRSYSDAAFTKRLKRKLAKLAKKKTKNGAVMVSTGKGRKTR